MKEDSVTPIVTNDVYSEKLEKFVQVSKKAHIDLKMCNMKNIISVSQNSNSVPNL